MKVAKPFLRTSISFLVLVSMYYDLTLGGGRQASLENVRGTKFIDSHTHVLSKHDEECWLQPYIDFHADAVKSLRHGHCVPSLVYVCEKNCGGIGDRMSGIISAFYLAVALDRAFFIDYKSPFPLTETLVPKTMRWDYRVKRKCTTTNGFRSKENEIFMVDSESPDQVLRRIEQLHERVTQLFDFAPEVKHRASQMTEELAFGTDAEFIAVHIRIGGRPKKSTRVVGWIDPKRHEIEDAATFFDCADSKRRNAGSISKSSPIVLFSDSEELKKAPIVAARGVRVVESTHISHTDRSWSFSKQSMRRGNVDTFAELYLMSRASCIVGSNSTYSGLASSLTFPPRECFSYFGNCTELRWDFWTQTERSVLR